MGLFYSTAIGRNCGVFARTQGISGPQFAEDPAGSRDSARAFAEKHGFSDGDLIRVTNIETGVVSTLEVFRERRYRWPWHVHDPDGVEWNGFGRAVPLHELDRCGYLTWERLGGDVDGDVCGNYGDDASGPILPEAFDGAEAANPSSVSHLGD